MAELDPVTKKHVTWLREQIALYLPTRPDDNEDYLCGSSKDVATWEMKTFVEWLDPQPATPEDEIAAMKQRVAQLEADNLRKQREIEDKQQEIDSWKL